MWSLPVRAKLLAALGWTECDVVELPATAHRRAHAQCRVAIGAHGNEAHRSPR